MAVHFQDWTLDDVKKYNARTNKKVSKNDFNIKNDKLLTKNKKSKYGANKCEIDGIKFDSRREANRYLELKQLEKAGVISDLQLQVPFVLQDSFVFNGKKIQAIKYIADFTYWENGELVIEDTKGMRTDVYNIKKKMFMYRYKKYIKEV